MPRIKTIQPTPNKNKGQRSIDVPDIPLFLPRILPGWGNPGWVSAATWRAVVKQQPFAGLCRDFLIANIVSMDWKIEPKDSEKRDELKDQIEYYTNFIDDTGEYSYADLVEWICTDMLDLPFGGAAELGRENDDPEGKVVWIEPLDGGTLFPTFNSDFPIGQTVPESMKTVYFPKHAIDRIYLSPRTEIKRKGWGMAPPEKIYLALELLNRGDIYYANLLLDTPQTGILDLGDMSTDSATKWVESWRNMLSGIDPFKIPVLYEHEKPVSFIPFVRSPTELMFDKSIIRYGGIVTAGYGITLSDIGFSATASGGDTLAGSIRSERRTRKTGLAVLKKKIIYFFNRILPKDLKFIFIDLDDEVSVAVGRARLASATAMGQWITNKVLTPKEARLQLIADGLINISIPEDVPMEDFPEPELPGGVKPNAERPSMMGRPVAPSAGGQGEVRNSLVSYLQEQATDTMLLRFAHDVFVPTTTEIRSAIESIGIDTLDEWEVWHDDVLVGIYGGELPEITKLTLSNSKQYVANSMRNTHIIGADIVGKFVENTTKNVLESLHRWAFITGDDSEPSMTSIDVPAVSDLLMDHLSEEVSRSYISVVRNSILQEETDEFVDLMNKDDFLKSLRTCYLSACSCAVDKFLLDLYDIISKDNRKADNA